MNLNTSTITWISAELSHLSSLENAVRTADLEARLKTMGATYRPARGRYNGFDEQSFGVWTDGGDSDSLDMLRDLARDYGQETVVEIGPSRDAYLIDLTTEKDLSVYAGQWKEVTYAEAKRRDGYTEIDGRFWIIGIF